jgi:DNA invertase Pin-like site-specific DNA recombinase
LRCAIYTRKSTEEGLEQEFNSLDAQREAAEAFILSQRREGWIALPERYDDGGFTGANMDRPALTTLIHAVEAGELDCVVVYKVDRLSRSLLDFTRMLSVFEKHKVSFVAVTQQFNTSTSLGRLTLNILLSFAQFERELIGERTRDKMSAARRKGKWVGGCPVLGYDVDPGGGRLIVNEEEAKRVRAIFALFEKHPLDFRAGKQSVRAHNNLTSHPPGGEGAEDSIPRIARLMALAIRFEGMLRDETIPDYAELARLGRVTRARMTQIMKLRHLAPDIQEQILFLPPIKGLNERNLRPIVSRIDWREQRRMFRKICDL